MTNIKKLKQYFAIFGAPVSHSLSPVIHSAFAAQFEIAIRYEKIEVPKGKFHAALEQFKASGGVGANITLPFKQEAFRFCDKLSETASHCQAVNTIGWEGDILWGDNTDGRGLLQDFANKSIVLAGKRVLLLGAGGAAMGILPELLKHNPEQIILVNRTVSKAIQLAAQDPRIKPYDYASLSTLPAFVDIVINATSSSLQNGVPDLPPFLIKDTTAVDLAYLPNKETAFMLWAKKYGATHVWDGIGMLVEQAAISFQRWHGVFPNTIPVIEKIKSIRTA